MTLAQGQSGWDASQTQASGALSRESFYNGSAAGATALVVEDNPSSQFALRVLLERGRMIVITAASGTAALRVLGQRPDISLVLMDIMIPVMDGYQTMAAIRHLPIYGDMPIIAVTGKGGAGERERCIAAGASDFIPKPIDTAKLLEALSHWLPV
jgi:CheY-like chemotaxis protein